MNAISPIRIALRHEGDNVNAYLAQTGTMEGAKLLGSLAVSMASLPGVFDAWQAFWQQASKAAIGALMPDVTVQGFDVREAPEHEKAGHA